MDTTDLTIGQDQDQTSPNKSTLAGRLPSLIETAKLNGVEPHAYLTRTLEAIVGGHKQRDINQLLPWNYAD